MGYEWSTAPGDPLLENWQNKLFNFAPKKSYADKTAKGWLKALQSGADVSSLGYLNSLRQKEAADLSGVDMDYMTGANQLLSNAGGEQAGLMNRLRDLQKEKIRQNTGMNMVDALAGLGDSAMSTVQRGSMFRAGQRQDAMQGAMGNRLGYYQGRNQLVYKPGWLDKLQQFSQIFSNFSGGAASAKAAGAW